MNTLEIPTSEIPVVEKPKKVKKQTGYIKAWGEVFSKFGKLGKEKCEQEMIKRFPHKEESIKKWSVWYRGYYNMGSITGFEDIQEPVRWVKAPEITLPEVQN